MGIRHLQTLQQKTVENGYYRINVIEEIRQSKNPILVIDLLGLVSLNNQNKSECLTAGRNQVYERLYTNLFQRLIDAGAELVFFVDGPVQKSKDGTWRERQNRNYKISMGLLDAIDSGKLNGDTVEDNYVLQTTFFVGELNAICKTFGRFFASYNNECDVEIAEFAVNNNALAVIANDSDFLVHQGNWRYWSVEGWNLEDFTTFEYDRQALRHYLGLCESQMKLFATIGGNDVLKYDAVRPFHVKLGNYGKFKNIAQYIRNNFPNPELMVRDKEKLCVDLFGGCSDEWMDLIENSLQSYDLTCVLKNNVTDEILQYAIDDNNKHLYCALTDQPISFYFLYEDFRLPNYRSIYEIALPLNQKLLGIILQHKQDPDLVRQVNIKRTYDEPINIHTIRPEYPQIQLPPLQKWYATHKEMDDPYKEMRYLLLVWLLESKRIDENLLKTFSPDHLVSILALVFLHEQNILTTYEADLLLVMVNDIMTDQLPPIMPYPKVFDKRLVVISHLYMKMFKQIIQGIRTVGFSKSMIKTKCYFDGIYLHKLGLIAKEKVKTHMRPISHLRIYAN